MKPKVSVIIPVYGVEKYIARCAESLFRQTLDEVEFIFVNDCTLDRSIEILNEVLLRYPERIKQTRIIDMPHNSGQAKVRKIGILEARGEYVINCDSDDKVEIDCYEKLYNYAKNNNYDIVFHNYYRVNNSMTSSIINCGVWNNKVTLVEQFLSGKLKASLWLSMIKRDLFFDPMFVFPMGDMTEDLTIIIQIVVLSKKIGYLNDFLYTYYIHSNSIANSISIKSCKKRFYDCVENTSFLESFFVKMNFVIKKNIVLQKKINNLDQLLPCIYIYSYLRLYRNTYKGIFRKIIQIRELPFDRKVKFIIAYIGVYPIWHMLNGYKFAR